VVLFSLPGGIPVYAFSLLVGLGACAGLAWIAWRAPKKEALQRVDAGLWVLFGGLCGGRIVYCAIHWPYYQSQPWEILQVHLGGLSWPGALLGGFVALVLYARLAHVQLGVLADALLPMLVPLAVGAWLGCWLDGCAYGPLTPAGWGIPARDEWGVVEYRLPVQLLGALFIIGCFLLLENFTKNSRPGLYASLGFLGLSLILFGLSFLRADPAPLWRGLRLEAWAALALAGLALLALLTVYINNRKL
jgi:phosphatidylglycerol:prolipoprotein diacylglycerol transferase